jgi:hypothetical protein
MPGIEKIGCRGQQFRVRLFRGIRSVLWITEKLHPLQSALEALQRNTDLQKSWPVK